MRIIKRAVILAVLLWPLSLALPAVHAGGVTVSGTIKNPGGKPAKDTRILLIELNRAVFVEGDGTFRFERIPAGSYHLQAVSRLFGSQVREIEVGDEDLVLELELGHMVHHESIVVTTGTTRGAAEIYQPVNVLDRNDLAEAMQPTIGETLKNEPGVNSTQYGAGSSRPVIRGQGAGRVRILEDGLVIGDASATSPDHAVASDPLSTERVEIVRGPATLLYGNTAVGGVVNMLDERIPDHVPQKPIGGTAELRAGSVATERGGAAELRGGGGQVAWYLNAFKRKADDYEIPGNAVAGNPNSPSGTLPNSAVENDGATLGVSWVGKTGYVGVSGRLFNSLYGIPVSLEEESIRIDLEQRRFDLHGGFDTEFGPFNGIDFRAGVTDYEHAEIAGAEIGTRFFQDTSDARLELRHGSGGKLRGAAGLQLGGQKLEAVGAEAFLPPSETEDFALFAVEEVGSGPMVYEAGLRLQRQQNRASGRPDRDFNGWSGSFGVAWRPGEVYSIGASISRTERFPRAEELYADGPHLATFSFEVGDPALDTETSLGLELLLRKRTGRVSGELNLFANRYDDFIYEMPTGRFLPAGDPELPEFQWTQADAEFVGAELSLRIEMWESTANHLGLEIISDYVRAEFRDSGEPLPYIPPLRVGAGLHYRGARWHASIDYWYYDEQTRVPALPEFDEPLEPELLGLFGLTPTPGYDMVHAHVGYRLPAGGMLHDFLLRGTNLTDEEARNSVSRLKDLVPLPGRDVGLVYRLIF